ncbi:MAG: ATPase [Desulfurococcaceae archaeon]
MDPLAFGLAYSGAVLAVLGGAVGSSLGLGASTRTGAAVIGEDIKQVRNVIILASLPMTQTFYGLIVTLLIITRVNSLYGSIELDKGLFTFTVGLMVGLAELFSAWFQGLTCASGIAELIRTRGAITFNAIILAVYLELIGIMGMVSGIIFSSLVLG